MNASRVRVSVAAGLSEITRPWWPTLAVVALLVVGAALLQLGPPLIVRRIVDDHLAAGNADGLLLLALLFLLVTAAAQVVTFGYTYLAAHVAQWVLMVLRVELFEHFQQLPATYFDHTPLGDAISRCTSDVETVDTLFSSGVSVLVANLVLVLTTAAAMILLSPPLALVGALALPFLAITTRFFQVRTRQAERQNRVAIGSINAELQESLGGIQVIRAFSKENYFVRRFQRTLHAALLAYNRATVYSALYTPTMALLAALVTALLLWTATRQELAAWGISIGTLTAFILLFQRFFKPITDLGEQWQTVQAALSGLERIFEVLAIPAESLAQAAPVLAPSGAAVEIRDVVFGYLENRPVLHGLSLTIQRGEQVAVVGRTGAGKTSLLHLVAGLYLPWAGSVRVFGVDPRSIAEEDRRRWFGVVPQNVHLFGGSVRDNITLGDRSVSRDALQQAAELVGLHSVIASLPGVYEADLGQGGGNGNLQLSMGQQQLLALARVLVWDPRLLLLDEATSALDNASDAALRAALRSAVREQGKAVLTIAHRLATAREADRVIVLDRGRIVEEGAPAALVRDGGHFAALLELETAGWDWRAASSPTDPMVTQPSTA